MAFEIDCDRCGREIKEHPALVHAPPDWVYASVQYYICPVCWNDLEAWLNPPPAEVRT